MIQRIQSIYLLSAMAFLFICFFAAFGQLGAASIGMYHLSDGVDQVIPTSTYYVYIPITAVLVLNLLALIQYKKRHRQMVIVRLTFIILAVVFMLSALTVMAAREVIVGETFVPGMAFISPFFAFVCNYLALKAIRKDEDLVRSVNRVR